MDLRARLESGLGASYTIERELGPGGMARVFVATERSLNRRVVIKVLPPDLAADVSVRRFEREIRLAAALQHANIVPLLSAGETDGLPHYTMPFVDGVSLRERLERGAPLPIQECIAILRDVGRALAYAHERGVVHRDIKPENVLLSGDAAVVTDFGIAKAIANARLGEPPTLPVGTPATVTRTGVAIGTPQYMAPEQISGDPAIDHRADIYAFGCLAYELLTGRVPFQAPHVHGLFAAHLAEPPVPASQRNAAVPASLDTLVMRCLEKDPAHRPQSAREILHVLQEGAASGVRWSRPRARRARATAIAATAVVIVGIGAWLARGLVPAAPPSVVVIPFINASGDSSDEYLADGMADGLATALGKLEGVRVTSRTLGYRYRGRRDLDVRAVGRELGVSHVLHGSVQRIAGRLRVSAHLARASDSDEVWSDSYDRMAGDAVAISEEITRLVAAALPRRLTGGTGTVPASASTGTADPQAYDLYLRGRYLLQRRGAGVRQSLAYLADAIARDSTFARAHAALALGLELLPYFELVRIDSVNALAIPAARRALALDSTISEAHTALAMAHQHRYEWRQAEDAYRRAVAAEPADADAMIQYGRFLFYTRTVREALPWFERARALDPTSAVASTWLGHMLELSGRVDEAMPHLRRAMDIDSTNPPSLVMISLAHMTAGRRDSARVYAERLLRVWPGWRAAAASLLADIGEVERARQLMAQLAASNAMLEASAYASLKDSSTWLTIKERQTAERVIWPTYLSLSERNVDFMRGSARFAALVRSVGLDERIFTAPRGGRP